MPIEKWSDQILVVELQDDPAFTDDLTAAIDETASKTSMDVVLDFTGVTYLNSSNIAKLLRLRKQLLGNKRRLVLCTINTNVWGLFMVTGLDNVFEIADTVAIGLTAVQLAEGA